MIFRIVAYNHHFMLLNNHKITIPLMGGLGNQLFQFAAGIYLSKFSSKEVRFSVFGLLLSRNTARSYMLGDLLKQSDITARGRVNMAVFKLMSLLFPSVWISEKDLSDDPLSRITSTTKVSTGYFQRKQYVDSVATELIRSMSQSNTFGSLISARVDNEIAVHIRIGDYLSNSDAKEFHGLSAMTYFVRAVNHLQSVHRYDKIVIYSDDLGKAYSDFTEAFGPNETPVVASGGLSELEDLAGISASRGIVISNSTFSWWAAWLGTQLHACDVVAPRPWFAIPSAADDNLLPDEWAVISRELQI
jgi:hypothetical protein